jgi:SAM-dependent methyltransferase
MNDSTTCDAYTPKYFGAFRSTSRTSAQVVVPQLIEWFAPASVIDLGCGTGEWLAAFEAAGVSDIHGVDGTYVDRNQLAIRSSAFKAHDFAEPFRTDRRYDLAMSVEVAEHLEVDHGASLVRSLVEAADVILFSAAAPHQAGVKHVNCQWPAYWSRLFRGYGYIAIDAIRPRIWSDSRVDWWYRQNVLLYINESRLPQFPSLTTNRTDEPLALVHPEMLTSLLEWGLDVERKYWDLWRQCHGKTDDIHSADGK